MKEKHKLQYNDPHSLLVVENNGRIKKIYTPFTVECKHNLWQMKKGDKIIIRAVDEESHFVGNYKICTLIFITEGQRIEHYHFIIF